MIFNKTLVSLIAAFAAASGVAASVATVPRDNGSFPPPNLTPIPIGSCNLGSAQCCDTVTSTSNPAVAQISGLLSLGGLINPDLGVGLSCLPIPLSSVQCDNSPVCCDNVYQSGLISVGCTPINLAL